MRDNAPMPQRFLCTGHRTNQEGRNMKTMGKRLVVLLVGIAALLQFETRRPGIPRRSTRLAGGEHARSGPAGDDPERGDVPGWVMITLMSAVLVAALLALAGPALEAMFNQAMDKVGR